MFMMTTLDRSMRRKGNQLCLMFSSLTLFLFHKPETEQVGRDFDPLTTFDIGISKDAIEEPELMSRESKSDEARARIKKIQDELPSLKEQCCELLSAKQVLLVDPKGSSSG
ncbi:hypothetical protein L6452_27625 [Arctium lappa]|uniref:Uncharacterized protein n=1 Tax=Arctium lappa TaxID=4217 RepID=A0ACB8ZVL3_ARCLA|nr:hypothetical protein L6452_27625 [Arctium lappa]